MRNSRYSEGTVRLMIQDYAYIRRGTKPGRDLDMLLRYADLDLALARLPLDEWRVVLVHGLLGVPRRVAPTILETSERQMNKLFNQAVEGLVNDMNGGTE